MTLIFIPSSSPKILLIVSVLALLSLTPLVAQAPTFLEVGAGACPAEAAFGQVVTMSALVRGGAVESYRWVQLAENQGPPVMLSSDEDSVVSFIAPDEEATLSFVVNVVGTGGDRASDTLSILVSEQGLNLPRFEASGTALGVPVCSQPGNEPAEARVVQAVRVEGGVDVSLSAEDGTDPDDTRVFIGGLPAGGVSYQWSVAEGAGLLTDEDLEAAESPMVSFRAPRVSETTQLTLSLLIADVADCGTRYDVDLIVEPRPLHCPEVPPVALARVTGVAQGQRVVRSGDEFLLDAALSGVPGEDEPNLLFEWTQLSGEPVFMKDRFSPQVEIRVDEVQSPTLSFGVRVASDLGSDDAVLTIQSSPLSEIYFSQIAYGTAGPIAFASVPVLINDSGQDAEVTLEFFDQAGDPQSLMLDGDPWDPAEPVTLPAQSSREFLFSSASDGFTVGWGRVTSDVPLTGLVLYRLLDAASGAVDFELGLFDSKPGARFTTLYGRDDGLAVAVANPGLNPADVRFEVLDHTLGSQNAVAIRNITLGPGEQTARFLDESFLGVLPENFQTGTLSVREIDGRSLVATVLKTDGGLLTSTLPVAVQRGRSGVIGANRPPTARLRFQVGDGEVREAEEGEIIQVMAPVEIVLDAGTTTDDLGIGNLSLLFDIQQNLQSGGAFISVTGETSRLLQIAEGTSGSIVVTVTATDSLAESDSIQVTFDVGS